MLDFDDFEEFYAFETGVLAAVERDDVTAACDMVLAAGDFPRTVRRLPALPEDVRRRLAQHCAGLYEAAATPERRERILTMHAGLLARRVDPRETEGFEAAVLATMQDDASAADARKAPVEEFPSMVQRLRTFYPAYRRQLSEHILAELFRRAEDAERRERILWMDTALVHRPYLLNAEEALALAMVREAVEHLAPAEGAQILESDRLLEVSYALARLPREARRRLAHHCVELYEAAETRDQRESAVWMRATLTSHPLKHLDAAALEPMLRVAVEHGDAAAACEMVLSDKDFSYTAADLPNLPKNVQRPLLEACADLYASATSESRRDRITRMHALLSLSLGLPDDRLAAARQKALNLSPSEVFWSPASAEMAWVELASGRDVPVTLGAEFRRHHFAGHRGKALRTVVRLLADRHPVLNAGEPWANRALADLAELPAIWTELIAHAVTATKSRPDAAWERKGRALLAAVDAERFSDRVVNWLTLVPHPATLPNFDVFNYHAARGLVWLLSFLPENAQTVRGLGTLLHKSLRTAPGIGPAMPKLANACAVALCAMEGEAALAEVARLTTRVTYKSTLNLLKAGLDARAQALGLGRDEIEELAVPVYGLTEVGRRVVQFGDVRAELVVDNGRAEVRWHDAKGKAVKSVPATVRHDHPEDLKELKGQVKDIAAMLTSVAKRLDRQFLTGREWPFALWRERYLDHPLVGTLARRLLWTIDGVACRYSDGALRDLSGEPVTARGTVRLWHPVDHPIEEVLAWRERLEQERLTQPFKQAHREVYLLTDAERRTATYSNRFAGHFLRQYAFRSLAAERAWRDPALRISHRHYSYPPAMRDLPEWGMRAEYWVRGEGSVYADLDSRAYELLAADQVRFYPIDAPEHSVSTMGGDGFGGAVAPLPLAEIPARVLSEVLRDVDLFVGVTSVGNDPTWQDGGPEGRYQDYWSTYSFGALSETARTRHDLLVRLLPRLAIGDRCHVEERFLHVKGELHTYKIHLGSGNILMDPGDRYLCIVPENLPRSSPEEYLPFDGDRTLSLILSKALMLSDDTKITEPTILSQLRREETPG